MILSIRMILVFKGLDALRIRIVERCLIDLILYSDSSKYSNYRTL